MFFYYYYFGWFMFILVKGGVDYILSLTCCVHATEQNPAEMRFLKYLPRGDASSQTSLAGLRNYPIKDEFFSVFFYYTIHSENTQTGWESGVFTVLESRLILKLKCCTWAAWLSR